MQHTKPFNKRYSAGTQTLAYKGIKEYERPVKLGLLWVLLTFVFISYSMKTGMNSDHASVLLQAKDLFEGNLFLTGWTLSTVSYYTTDFPFYALSIMLAGFGPYLLHVIPAMLYAAVVVMGIYLARPSGAFLAFAFLGVPTLFLSTFALVPGVHIGTILYCLIAFALLEKKKLIAASVFLTLAVIGDPFALYVGCLPILIACGYFYIRKKEKTYLYTFGVTVLSIVLAKLVLKIIEAAGGFTVPGIDSPKFLTLDKLWHNLTVTVRGVLGLFGADFFGQTIASGKTVLLLLHFAAFLALMYFFIRSIKSFIRGKELDFISVVIMIGALLNLFSFTFSNMPGGDLATTRYITPFFLFSVILVARETKLPSLKSKYAIPAICLIYALTLVAPINYKNPYTFYDRLSQYLIDNNLKYGYAGFWESSIVTIQNNEGVKVRPVIPYAGIARYDWLSKREWYDEPGNFIVIPEKNQSFIQDAKNTFGEPAKTLKYEDMQIMVWDKNISPLLKENKAGE